MKTADPFFRRISALVLDQAWFCGELGISGEWRPGQGFKGKDKD
jgi:hypothetical protein